MLPLLVGLSFLVLLAGPVGSTEAGQTPAVTRARLERAASELTHFATADLIYNRWSEPQRWPVGMLEAQQDLLRQLRAVALDRDGLRGLLQDADPHVRSPLVGLFIREDPQDLPFIARLVNDKSQTLPHLGRSLNSMGGRMPLSAFESPQTVGDVAQSMIRFYLSATDR